MNRPKGRIFVVLTLELASRIGSDLLEGTRDVHLSIFEEDGRPKDMSKSLVRKKFLRVIRHIVAIKALLNSTATRQSRKERLKLVLSGLEAVAVRMITDLERGRDGVYGRPIMAEILPDQRGHQQDSAEASEKRQNVA